MTSRSILLQAALLSLLLIAGLAAYWPIAREVRLPSPAWTYSDLRALDPADSLSPSHDLIAVYTHTDREEVRIRLDLLSLEEQVDYNLYLALDTVDGGTHDLPLGVAADLDWEVLLILPAAGPLQVLGQDGRLPAAALQAVRNPRLDNLEIRLNRSALGRSREVFNLQVFMAIAGSRVPTDVIGPVASYGPPPKRAPLLLAFWNTFPAYTPAQALRRWDGAHTGPLGGRHGLFNLLRTAQSAGFPLALLDLKGPASLSALDYAGDLSLIQEMAARGLLLLPQTLPACPGAFGPDCPLPPPADWTVAQASEESRQQGLNFGLPAGPFAYDPQGLTLTAPTEPTSAPARTTIVFTHHPSDPGGVHFGTSYRRGLQRVISLPLPGLDETSIPQVFPDGLSLEVRRALIQAALETNGRSFLVLGGDLPNSSWGAPQAARAAFEYLSSRPWVDPLSSSELLARTYSPTHLQSSRRSPNPIIPFHRSSSPLFQAAWESYLSLYAPLSPAPAGLAELRSQYLGQVKFLEEAVRWAACEAPCRPASHPACDLDLDGDGQLECILSSQDVLAILASQDGSLLYAFARDQDGAHQLVGPSSQLIVGLGDPDSWDLTGGLQADPTVIPGAFAEPDIVYTHASITEESLTFSAAAQDPLRRKTYTLSPGSLHMKLEQLPGDPSASVQIPVVLDPWLRFSPGWGDRYQQGGISGGWFWEIEPGPRVEILTSGRISVSAFSDSRFSLERTEDPNRDYPPGHFLPFPLALVEVVSDANLEVTLRLVEGVP